MSEFTPNEAVLQLTALAREIDVQTRELNEADFVAVRAKHAFEIAWARAILTVEASNADSRKARATLDTEAELWAVREADHHVQAGKRVLDSLRTRIDVGRSALSAKKSEWMATT